VSWFVHEQADDEGDGMLLDSYQIYKNQPERITINQGKSQGWCGKAAPINIDRRKHRGEVNLSLLKSKVSELSCGTA
jgi:hypothetical protein